MKPLTAILTGILIILGVAEGWCDEESGTKATDFLKMWDAWNTSDIYKYDELSLEYRCETHNWVGIRDTSRRVLHFGEGEKTPFGAIEAMRKVERLHNVEALAGYTDTFTMVLTHALTLKEGARVETLPAELTCQMDGGKPRRFIFVAETPKRWLTQRVRLVYTWNFHEYDEERYWVPDEMLIEYLVKNGTRQAVISQRWTLTKILEGPRSDTGAIQPVEDER